jgi:hypothetical protein
MSATWRAAWRRLADPYARVATIAMPARFRTVAGRKQAILSRRERIKRESLERRKRENLG